MEKLHVQAGLAIGTLAHIPKIIDIIKTVSVALGIVYVKTCHNSDYCLFITCLLINLSAGYTLNQHITSAQNI